MRVFVKSKSASADQREEGAKLNGKHFEIVAEGDDYITVQFSKS